MPDTPTPVDLCGTGVILFADQDAGQLVAVPARCHRWDCPHCSKVRVRQARAKAAAGKPERLVTLTTRPQPDLSLEDSVRWIRERWKRLLERLRRNFPRTEYMAFVELHKSGWPHMHILTKGCYVPQRLLSRWWSDLTASHRVDIRAIDRSWAGIREATKYYLKTARQVHEAAPRLPVYTCSRGWLPEDWAEGDRPAGNWQFYCFVRMEWDAFTDELREAGLQLTPVPDQPGRYVIEFTGPPDPEYLRMTWDLGTYAQQDLAAALDAYFQEVLQQGAPLAHAQDVADFYTDPAYAPV